MAKKKKRKDDNKKPKNGQFEITGFIILLIAIIGIALYGPVGNFIHLFATFLVGEFYGWLLALLIIIASYMIIKREKPNFFTSKLIGFYLIILAILVFAHLDYFDNFKGLEIIKETFNNLMSHVGDIESKRIYGGGIIGGAFSLLFVTLFSLEGTNLVTWVLLLCGIILFTGLSIYDIIMKIKNKVKGKLNRKDREDIKKAENKYENDNKIVISSMDELINIPEETPESKPEVKEEIVENKGYLLPPINIMNRPMKSKTSKDELLINDTVNVLEQVFKDFMIDGKVVAVNIGPSVTQYEMEIKAGTKVSKILSINREIALALAAKDVRIQAPIPGKKTIGVEIPNPDITMVSVREILENIPKSLNNSKLLVTLGKDIMGKPTWAEINKMPHLLVAGATGSGKSVCINSMIISLLMRTRPDEVRLVLVDPKKVELSMYNGAPHLLAPVVTDPRKANIALKKIVDEMERRYEIFSDTGAKNIAGYNLYIEKKNKNLDEAGQLKKLPYIVVIIDELADLMLVAAKEVEDSIMRITQMARAAGIHLIVATQRPSTDVITGLIKANIPSRISFAVSSNIDSRTILDMSGAEKLLGKGDMLFLPMGENTPIRIQGTFISEEEIKGVVDFTIQQQKAHYDETLTVSAEEQGATTMLEKEDYDDPLYNEIVEFVVTQGKASASLLQRRFRLGYNRAARIIDLLEERGIVGPQNGSKPREVLVKLEKDDD
ncbi:MAG: DNA translocase FtsK [Bacilli bacterium]|nr:DNA translocase FtsK [Bacilli bacterium]MDD4809502.1 DNA translocase FtsK [Bacilli bacterium]